MVISPLDKKAFVVIAVKQVDFGDGFCVLDQFRECFELPHQLLDDFGDVSHGVLVMIHLFILAMVAVDWFSSGTDLVFSL